MRAFFCISGRKASAQSGLSWNVTQTANISDPFFVVDPRWMRLDDLAIQEVSEIQ
jgi:hypothetical protein